MTDNYEDDPFDDLQVSWLREADLVDEWTEPTPAPEPEPTPEPAPEAEAALPGWPEPLAPDPVPVPEPEPVPVPEPEPAPIPAPEPVPVPQPEPVPIPRPEPVPPIPQFEPMQLEMTAVVPTVAPPVVSEPPPPPPPPPEPSPKPVPEPQPEPEPIPPVAAPPVVAAPVVEPTFAVDDFEDLEYDDSAAYEPEVATWEPEVEVAPWQPAPTATAQRRRRPPVRTGNRQRSLTALIALATSLGIAISVVLIVMIAALTFVIQRAL
ncbi:MAG: Procyclic acidic repetitive protein [Actinomycetota bacterium]